MTREEAIAILYQYSLRDMTYPKEDIEAFEWAIRALKQKFCEDCISREKTLEKFCDYVGSGMSMNDFDALYDIVAKMPRVQPKTEPCGDCLFKKEWEKIGKLISVILEKQTEQEPIGHWIMHDRHRECSKCGVWFPKDMPRNSYCPNCGCRMSEVSE